MLLRFISSSGYFIRFSLYCLSLACVLTIVRGYNLDTDKPLLFTDPNNNRSERGSYFGFSTALYVKRDKEGRHRASVLVGAPRANVTKMPELFEPGIVFNCEINEKKDNECVEWNLDTTGNYKTTVGDLVDQMRNNSWTGATIGVDYSSIEKPTVVVCAPNWKRYNSAKRTSLPMLGICYWSIGEAGNIFEKEAREKESPLSNLHDAPCRQTFSTGFGQVGFSMQLYSEENQSVLLTSGPSARSSGGAPMLIKDRKRPIIPTCMSTIKKPININVLSYIGYSVTSGFYYNETRRWHVASAPRSNDTIGKVIVFMFQQNFILVPNNNILEGEQNGEYFGASLASCDLNNDKKDEIIVGAPFWSSRIDEGRIYVFSENNRNFENIGKIDGKKSGARFGSVVTCLGDLDKDGYKDIAVGAPYESNHGAIYIYYGGKEGLNEGFSKRIYGKDISEAIRGFGAAISEPRDVDGNNYVDIAVGAYSSGHVVLLRSQPVVTIKVYVRHQMEDLKNTTKFLTVHVCSTYEGLDIPERLPVEITLEVDPQKMFCSEYSSSTGVYKRETVAITSKTEHCVPYNMTLVTFNFKDPIEIDASLALVRRSPSAKFCPTCPVISKHKSKLNDRHKLQLPLYCHSKVCMSMIDIAMEAASGLDNGHYTLGSKSHVHLLVNVSNKGEAAYNAKLHLFIPSPISPGIILPECQQSQNNGLFEITCELGDDLRDDPVTKRISLDMRHVQSDTERIQLFANVSTQSEIFEPTDYDFTIYVDVDVNMAITGKSEPDVHSFVNKEEMEEQKSIMRSQHIYTVQKFGKSPMEESKVTIWVPTHLRENNIEVARIIEISGFVDDRKTDCQILSQDEQKAIFDNMGIPIQSMSLYSDSLIAESVFKTPDDRSDEEAIAQESSNLYVPPANRTFYLNCTDQAVKCVRISCKLRKIADSNTLAKINITLDVQMKNLLPVVMETKDIIYLVSNASVSGFPRSSGINQRIETKYNSTAIGTTFVGSPTSIPLSTWIIVGSVLLGVLLLVLLILGLIKLGFFHRRKREELEALKARSDNDPGFVLETSSSREVLDGI